MSDLDDRRVWEERRFSRRTVGLLAVVGVASGFVFGVLRLAYLFTVLWRSPAETLPTAVILHALPRLALLDIVWGVVIGAAVGLAAAAGRAFALLLVPHRAAAIIGAVVPAFVVAGVGIYGFLHLTGLYREMTRPSIAEGTAAIIGALIVLVAIAIIDRRRPAHQPQPLPRLREPQIH